MKSPPPSEFWEKLAELSIEGEEGSSVGLNDGVKEYFSRISLVVSLLESEEIFIGANEGDRLTLLGTKLVKGLRDGKLEDKVGSPVGQEVLMRANG